MDDAKTDLCLFGLKVGHYEDNCADNDSEWSLHSEWAL